METTFDTKPLLRPAQVENLKQEISSAESRMQNKDIMDRGEARKQWLRLKKNMEDQAPRAPGNEEGEMVKREKALLDDILQGMPSQEEMRKAPPGAVDKHMVWEKRNKPKILEWKNLRLRLRPGETEAPNLERFRPRDSTLNMDNAVIPGRQIYIPDEVGSTVTFSDAELTEIRARSPEVADMIGLMTNEQRSQAKALLQKIVTKSAPKKQKRTMSAEHKAKLMAGRDRARANKAA